MSKMPTNEERREVSKKIRELTEDVWSLAKEWEEEGIFTNGQDQADYYQIHFAIFGTLPADHMHPCDYDELHKRLADLIEPEPERTCEILHDDNLSEQYGGPMARCSYCGAALPEEFIGPYYYCPCCGSKNKVVEQ